MYSSEAEDYSPSSYRIYLDICIYYVPQSKSIILNYLKRTFNIYFCTQWILENIPAHQY